MKQVVITPDAPEAIGPYVQGTVVGGLVFTSGQLPINALTSAFPETIEEQTLQSLNNVKAIIEMAGCSVSSICKVNIFVEDLNEFAQVNAVYAKFFDDHAAAYPARSCIEAARLPRDVKIEIEAIAFKDF